MILKVEVQCHGRCWSVGMIKKPENSLLHAVKSATWPKGDEVSIWVKNIRPVFRDCSTHLTSPLQPLYSNECSGPSRRVNECSGPDRWGKCIDLGRRVKCTGHKKAIFNAITWARLNDLWPVYIETGSTTSLQIKFQNNLKIRHYGDKEPQFTEWYCTNTPVISRGENIIILQTSRQFRQWKHKGYTYFIDLSHV